MRSSSTLCSSTSSSRSCSLSSSTEPSIGDLHSIQHDFQEIIETTGHMHQCEWCLETIFCHGEVSQIRELVYQLRDFDEHGRLYA
nr:hypothetical protein [Haloferax sp. Q22]